MEKEEFTFIQDQIGYQFKNLDLLQQAFVRRSYSQENGGEDNEVLEFIGDRALDIVVVKYLADTYGGFAREYEDFDADDDYDEFYCAYDESELSKIKQSLVCRKNLAKCIEKLELEEFLIMGESDVQQQIWKQDSVKEDLFEAIVGAVTLDSQWNFDQIEDAVKIMLGDTLSDFSDEETNYVNEVQQWCLWKNESMPLYHYEGPGKSVQYLWYTGFPGIILPFSDQDYRMHDGIHIAPDFYCMVNLRDKSLPLFCACGYSKSDARHRALSKMKLMIQTGQNRSASWKFWCGVVILIFPNIFLKKHTTKTAIQYGNALVSFLIMIGKQKESLPRRRKRRKMRLLRH